MDFSNAPYEFEETALLVKEDLQRLYFHAGTANRFSENYLKILPQMEKYIRQAGSFCLTKAVLEQKGFAFPRLEDLTVLELVRMVSFHIRKCHAAIDGLYRDNDRVGSVYFQWELRWIGLGERLKATGAKIQRIREGRLRADELIEREDPFRHRPRTNESGSGFTKSLFLNPNALPLDCSMASELLEKEKADRKRYEREQREFNQDERFMKQIWGIEGTFKPERLPLPLRRPEPEPESASEKPKYLPIDVPLEGGITEAEARRILMQDAMKRGDQQALMEIPLEDVAVFHARWMRHIEEGSRKEKDASSRAGPSEETRRKLREKRKKKK